MAKNSILKSLRRHVTGATVRKEVKHRKNSFRRLYKVKARRLADKTLTLEERLRLKERLEQAMSLALSKQFDCDITIKFKPEPEEIEAQQAAQRVCCRKEDCSRPFSISKTWISRRRSMKGSPIHLQERQGKQAATAKGSRKREEWFCRVVRRPGFGKDAFSVSCFPASSTAF